MDPLLEVQELHLSYDGQEAVRGVSFSLQRGAEGNPFQDANSLKIKHS